MLQNHEIIVRLNRIPDNRIQALQGILIRLHISRYLRLAVEIKRAFLNGLHDLLDLEAFTVQKAIVFLGEAVVELVGLSWGFGYDCSDAEGFEGGFEGDDGFGG